MSYWYLATPYSKWKLGMEDAYQMACREAALLFEAGLSVFSPIAHAHSVAKYGEIDLRHNFDGGTVDWLAIDKPFMDAAHGIIVCMMDGWQESRGIKYEIQTFERAGKPIHWMAPGHVPYSLTTRVA